MFNCPTTEILSLNLLNKSVSEKVNYTQFVVSLILKGSNVFCTLNLDLSINPDKLIKNVVRQSNLFADGKTAYTFTFYVRSILKKEEEKFGSFRFKLIPTVMVEKE